MIVVDPCHAGLLDRAGRAELFDQSRHRGCGEEGMDGQVHMVPVVHLSDNGSRDEGLSPEGEEVRVDAYFAQRKP